MDITSERRARLVELLLAAGRGSETAFGELYEATHAYLYYVALGVLGAPPLAEETLQDAYLSIWLQAWRFRPELGSAMAWLIATVRNHAISALRSQRGERHVISLSDSTEAVEEALLLEDEEADPFRRVDHACLRRRMAAAQAILEPAQRQAIALTFQHGMTHAELAAHMQAPLGTVKSWMRRGLARLNTHFQQEACAGRRA